MGLPAEYVLRDGRSCLKHSGFAPVCQNHLDQTITNNGSARANRIAAYARESGVILRGTGTAIFIALRHQKVLFVAGSFRASIFCHILGVINASRSLPSQEAIGVFFFYLLDLESGFIHQAPKDKNGPEIRAER